MYPEFLLRVNWGEWVLLKMRWNKADRRLKILLSRLNKNHQAGYDLIIIGAGPAGISACLTAKKHGKKFLLLEQDTLGGTVFTFPTEENRDDFSHGPASLWKDQTLRNQQRRSCLTYGKLS